MIAWIWPLPPELTVCTWGRTNSRRRRPAACWDPMRCIGVSTHGIEQARQAVLDGANYIGCGPTFPSATKRFQHFPGLEYLRQVSREIALPAFAIGGIDADNVAEVRQAGISRVAVSHSVIDQPDPEQASRALAARLFNGCS